MSNVTPTTRESSATHHRSLGVRCATTFCGVRVATSRRRPWARAGHRPCRHPHAAREAATRRYRILKRNRHHTALRAARRPHHCGWCTRLPPTRRPGRRGAVADVTTTQIEFVTLSLSPVSTFEDAWARCHGPQGSFPGKEFARLNGEKLAEVVREMMEGPASLQPSDADVRAMTAYHHALAIEKTGRTAQLNLRRSRWPHIQP
jgi:hypothetical protein